MPEADDRPLRASRRTVLVGATTLAGAATLSACGHGSKGSSSSGTPAASAGGSSGGAGTSQTVIALASVPVGGAASAKTKDGKPVIVSQPQAGEVVAFSAVCTHMGCTVAPQTKLLQCPCHGSQYSLADGSVIRGPAPRALAKLQAKIDGSNVVVES